MSQRKGPMDDFSHKGILIFFMMFFLPIGIGGIPLIVAAFFASDVPLWGRVAMVYFGLFAAMAGGTMTLTIIADWNKP